MTTWQILGVFTYPEFQGVNDVVYAAQYRVSGPSGSVVDRVGFSFVAGQAFTPRYQLDDDIIIGWVQSELGPDKVAELEAAVQ